MGLVGLSKQLALNEQCPEGLLSDAERPLEILDAEYWRCNFKDLHSIKLAYSAVELNRALGDDAIPLRNLSRHIALFK